MSMVIMHMAMVAKVVEINILIFDTGGGRGLSNGIRKNRVEVSKIYRCEEQKSGCEWRR